MRKIFKYEKDKGGIFCPKFSLAPWPGFIFRRQAILDMIDYCDIPPRGKFMEIGYGTGIFLYEFFIRKFKCFGYDFSKTSIETANAIFNSDKKRFVLKTSLSEDDKESYDCLGAFEVLEHIEDDVSAIREWNSLLKKDGTIIISVPARKKYWGYMDLRVGHVRRYEKDELQNLLTDNGFEIVKFINYGFPFTTFITPLSTKVLHKKEYLALREIPEKQKTELSGTSRKPEYKFHKLIPYRILALLSKTEKLFYNTDLGQGYVVVARKK